MGKRLVAINMDHDPSMSWEDAPPIILSVKATKIYNEHQPITCPICLSDRIQPDLGNLYSKGTITDCYACLNCGASMSWCVTFLGMGEGEWINVAKAEEPRWVVYEEPGAILMRVAKLEDRNQMIFIDAQMRVINLLKAKMNLIVDTIGVIHLMNEKDMLESDDQFTIVC